MARVDVTDEAVIGGPPATVYKTLLNELSGITGWWLPHLQCKSRDGKLVDYEGAIFDATIHPESRMRVKVSTKITKLIEPKSIDLEYLGDFIGTGKIHPPTNRRKNKTEFSLQRQDK